jgi:ABC-type branched-subunit amino acid transport system substrate-binding protein/uncharacterized surface protein with fasciclin (FAS1) repeats
MPKAWYGILVEELTFSKIRSSCMSISRFRFFFVLVVVLAFGLAACAPAEEATEEPVVDTPTEEVSEDVEATDEATVEETTDEEDMAEATAEATEEAMDDMDEDMAEATAEATAEAMGDDMEEDGDDAEAMDDMDMADSVMVAPSDPVRLGFAAALSGEGVSAFGIDINRGVELALEDRPTVTVGGVEFTVELDVQDSLCSPEGGQTVANRFASDDSIMAVIGPMCSSACTAAAPIFDDAGISSVSASCTAATLTNGDFASFNRTVPSDAAQGVVAADYIFNELGFTSIAVIDDGSAYGEGLVNLLVAAYEELGGTIVARDAVTVGDTDFRALLENISSEEPQLVYFGGFNAEAARLVEQRFDVGLEDVPFMGADGIFGPELIDLAGESAEGVYASAPVPASSDALDAFRERYIETYGEEPPSAFNTNSYDAANLVMDAIEAVGTIDDNGDLVVERAALMDYIRSATLSGLTGELACDGTGECSTADVAFYQIQDGAYVQLGGEDMSEDMSDDMGEEADAEATEEAMDDMGEEDSADDMDMAVEATETYEGAFTFMYPEGWEVIEGTDIVRLTMGDETILVSGPDNLALVLDNVEFEDAAGKLANFLDRAGYGVGEAMESDMGLATAGAELARRGQSGQATLVDLGFGREGVVIALSGDEGMMAGASAEAIIASFTYPPNIVDIASTTEGFGTLTAAVEAAGLADTLSGGEFTVFAPTDEAFATALEALGLTAEELLADTETLTNILLYHVVDGTVLAEDVIALDGESAATLLEEASVSIAVVDGGVVLNDSVNVTATDITASNGVIHVIDAVLLPPAGEEEATEETTEEVVDEASEEETADDEATEETSEEASEETSEEMVGTIVDVAVGSEDFSTLVAAVQAAGLVEALSAEDAELTVFAPTNEAFAAALEALGLTAEELLADTELLTNVLLYHVVPGTVLAEDVVALDGESAATLLEGASISIAIVDGGVVLNDSVNVTAVDVMASNGVIHVIDAVLLPPAGEEEAMEETSEDTMMGDGPSVMVAPSDPVRLGFAAALSGEGVSAFGIDINRGVELALEDRPTVTVGGVEFTVELDVQDSLCSPEGGQTVANRFASDDSIMAVIGPMCSSACTAAAPIFDDAGISSVSASCTAATLTNGDFASFNRTVPSDAAQGVVAADYIFNELGFTSIAVIDDGSAYGEGLVNLLVAAYEELGGTIVARDAVTVGDTDFRALLENISSEEPQLVYFGGFNAEAARLVEQRFDVGLEDVPFMGADGIFGPELIDLAGESAEGVYASAPVPASSDALDAFRERYIETYGEEPPSAFNTNSYDAANLVMDAIEAVGTIDDNGDLVVERAALMDYIRSATLSGLTGELACDGSGECSTADVAFYQIQDGAYVQLGGE